MKFLILQHVRVEHPGIFRTFLREDGHDSVTVQLGEGELPPPLANFDALWVMGGPMDVWEEDRYPWLKDEKRLIQEAVEEIGMPFLGLCLGHQLLAEADIESSRLIDRTTVVGERSPGDHVVAPAFTRLTWPVRFDAGGRRCDGNHERGPSRDSDIEAPVSSEGRIRGNGFPALCGPFPHGGTGGGVQSKDTVT